MAASGFGCDASEHREGIPKGVVDGLEALMDEAGVVNELSRGTGEMATIHKTEPEGVGKMLKSSGERVWGLAMFDV